MMSAGFNVGWGGPALQFLTKKPDAPFKLHENQTSLLASSLWVGLMFGAVLGFYISNNWSRSKLVLLSSLPFIISASIFTLWQSLYPFYVARFIAGIGTGIAYGIAPLYICEIASPKIRGTLCFILELAAAIGGVLVYCLIPFASFTTFSIICVGIAAVQFILCLFLPESPYLLLLRQDQNGARQVLQKIRNQDNVENELLELSAHVQSQLNQPKVTFSELIFNAIYRRALLLAGLTILVQQASGNTGLQAYSQVIFDTAALPISSDVCGIIYQAIGASTIFVSGSIVDTFGRRSLMLLSSLVVLIPLIILGTYYFLQYVNVIDVVSYPLVPLGSMVMHIVGGCLGIGPLPSVISNELMPTNIRPFGGLALTVVGSLAGIFTTVSFQLLDDAFGKFAPIWLYAILLCVSGILVFIYLPETKGKTLD